MPDSDCDSEVLLTVLIDGREIKGRYRLLPGNRIEVYTERSNWLTFLVDSEPVEDQAKDMLTRMARHELHGRR